MSQPAPKVLVIGGGIAGLCTGVLARRRGYEVEVVEQHHEPGGMAASWQRGGYTFETCLHWLVGTNPQGALHAQWREVCDIDRLRVVDHDEFVRVEDEHGGVLPIPSDVEALERQLLEVAPEDALEIRHFTGAVRQLSALPMPLPGQPWHEALASIMKLLPELPLLWRLAHVDQRHYGQRFHHPLLRAFFDGGASGGLSVLALVLALAWASDRNAGYLIGGSQALVRAVVERLQMLGGSLRLGTQVARIRVENNTAKGVELISGEFIAGDWVVSAADLYTTLTRMLGGHYRHPAFDTAFASYATFPSYLQVSLGVARNLSSHPGHALLVLDSPLEVDPQTRVRQLPVRIFHFDPTFAPPGGTAITCQLQTRNALWWSDLRQDDPTAYAARKDRVADRVIAALERRYPGIRGWIEVMDVSTPATVMRLTGNWQGSMEGWLMTPQTGVGPLPQALAGLHRFALAGHWVFPGGGLPSGLMTARAAVHAICHADHRPYVGS